MTLFTPLKTKHYKIKQWNHKKKTPNHVTSCWVRHRLVCCVVRKLQRGVNRADAPELVLPLQCRQSFQVSTPLMQPAPQHSSSQLQTKSRMVCCRDSTRTMYFGKWKQEDNCVREGGLGKADCQTSCSLLNFLSFLYVNTPRSTCLSLVMHSVKFSQLLGCT